jgi:AsmA protein
MLKKLLIAVAALLALVVVLIAGVLLFFDADQFRPKLEVMMAEALGRRVTIGRLKVALLSGGIAADDLMIADDPAFGRQPFVTAKAVTIGVDLMPLIRSRSLRVESFRLEQPKVVLLRSPAGVWNFSGLAAGSSGGSSAGTMSVLVQRIAIAGGQLVVGRTDASREQRTYGDVNIDVRNLSLTTRFPFTLTAKTPNGGSLRVEGNAGPFNAKNAAETPFGGTLTIKHFDVAATGFVDANAGVGGLIDFDGNLTSDGVLLKTNGKLSASNVQLLAGAGGSRVPIVVDYESTYNARSQSGTLKQIDVHIGKAVARLTGEYDMSGKSPSVRMTLAGPKMPVTELQSALPAIGVTLPPNASLKEGTLDVDLGITGPLDRLSIAGPLKLSNGLLAGFDLGGKMGALASFAGLKTDKDTHVESLSASLRLTPAGTAIDMLDMIVTDLGTLTGDGTISPSGAMDFRMLAKLASTALAQATGATARAVAFGQTSGIPFKIYGTTSNPQFGADMGRAVKSVANEIKQEATKPENLQKAADFIGGLFGKKKQEPAQPAPQPPQP